MVTRSGRSRGRYFMRRKSMSKTTMNHQNMQTARGKSSAVAPVALLIDGENVSAHDLIAHMLVEASKMGEVVVRQVYGNWAASCMQAWKKIMVRYALEPFEMLHTLRKNNMFVESPIISMLELRTRLLPQK